METPPELPPAKAPLDWQFYVILLTPLAFIVLFCCFANSGRLGGQILALAGLVTFACSVILAMKLGVRMGKTDAGRIGMGILMFFALQTFYLAFFFVGCVATLSLS